MRWNLKKVMLFALAICQRPFTMANFGRIVVLRCTALEVFRPAPHCHGSLVVKPFPAQHALLQCPNPRVFVKVVPLFRTLRTLRLVQGCN